MERDLHDRHLLNTSDTYQGKSWHMFLINKEDNDFYSQGTSNRNCMAPRVFHGYIVLSDFLSLTKSWTHLKQDYEMWLRLSFWCIHVGCFYIMWNWNIVTTHFLFNTTVKVYQDHGKGKVIVDSVIPTIGLGKWQKICSVKYYRWANVIILL